MLIEWREAKCRRAIVKNRTGKLAEKEKEGREGCWKEASTGPAEGGRRSVGQRGCSTSETNRGVGETSVWEIAISL